MKHISKFRALLFALLSLVVVGCESERPIYEGRNFIMFSAESHTLGVIDNEEWFEIPVSASRTADVDRHVGVEVIITESSAIEDMHYEIESHTLTIKAGELATALRIRGIADTLSPNAPVEVKLSLVLDQEEILSDYSTSTVVTLQRCCPFDINNFVGYAVLTSTWSMQYMNTDARLVRTYLDKEEGVIAIKDMFYEGYDIRVKLSSEDRLNPLASLCGAQVLGTTGEAFGTIYGNGKLMVDNPMGSVSYYSTCEGFLLLYTVMYVDEVGTVGNYINILEWISDEEAERIMREGF